MFEIITYFGQQNKDLAATALECVNDQVVLNYLNHLYIESKRWVPLLKPLGWLAPERAITILEQINEDKIHVNILKGIKGKETVLNIITKRQHVGPSNYL